MSRAPVFVIILFGISSIYDLAGVYAASLPASTAYFIGFTFGGAVVGAAWFVASIRKGET